MLRFSLKAKFSLEVKINLEEFIQNISINIGGKS